MSVPRWKSRLTERRFIPERWENPTTEMKDSFMPFGIGARGQYDIFHSLMTLYQSLTNPIKGCIGYQLARIELAFAATFFFRDFPHAKIASIMTEKDMELEDKFVMNPRRQKCLVDLE